MGTYDCHDAMRVKGSALPAVRDLFEAGSNPEKIVRRARRNMGAGLQSGGKRQAAQGLPEELLEDEPGRCPARDGPEDKKRRPWGHEPLFEWVFA